MFELKKTIRQHILDLKPYQSARLIHKDKRLLFLDANENRLGSVIGGNSHLYPDPQQVILKKRLVFLKKLDFEQVFVGNGSDEIIDLLIRLFCTPGQDSIITLTPTYKLYATVANINNVDNKEVTLLPHSFAIDSDAIFEVIDERDKIIFICNPNNPTGNSFDHEVIENIAKKFNGIVVVDEAYMDFCHRTSCIEKINSSPNLVVIQTLSKAWGAANLRVGMAFAQKDIIHYLNTIKPPYNVNGISQQLAYEAFGKGKEKETKVRDLKKLKQKLINDLQQLAIVKRVYPSDTNFLLVKFEDSDFVFKFLVSNGIIVRDVSNMDLCKNCLRITVGNQKDNENLMQSLSDYDRDNQSY